MTRLSIPDMTCGHCKAAVEKAVSSIDPSAKVEVDLQAHTAEIRSAADLQEILAALKEEGYEATPI